MRILIHIGHPAHVHFFKYFIWTMQKKGHEVLITATDKDVALRLLDTYGLKYMCVGKSQKNPIAKIMDLITADYRLWKIARRFGPDIFVGQGSITTAHVSALLRKPSIIFDDTEHSREQYYLYAPFVNVICTPSCFNRDLGKKQIRYNGYKELAYLHHDYFTPDPSTLGNFGLKEDDKFIIVRFVAWEASHDIGQSGLDMSAKRTLVEELEKYARVFITSESQLPEEFEKYRITLPPERMHDLLYYATLYVGEGGTMATEAAMLGIPSIFVSTLAQYCGNFEELEKKYGLIYSYAAQEEAITKAIELLRNKDSKREWQKKRERMLADKIDVTQFMVDFVENYPESFAGMKRDISNVA